MFGSTPDLDRTPILIHNETIKQVSSYKYLGVWIDYLFSWKDHVDFVCKRTKQSIYFLCRLRSFGASSQILNLFFTSVKMSILQYCNIVWYKSLSSNLKAKSSLQLKICSKIVRHPLQTIYETAYHKNMLRLAYNIVSNSNHVLNKENKLLPSKCRFRVPKFNKIKPTHSFVHQSIHMLNTESISRSKRRLRDCDVLCLCLLCVCGFLFVVCDIMS